MKNSVLIGLLFVSHLFFSQTSKQNKNSTPPASNKIQKGISNNHTQDLVNGALPHDNCVNKKFSVVIYVILDSNYQVGAATPLNINNLLNVMNTKFKNICITFENCSTVFIPNYSYNKWSRNTTDTVVTSQWYTKNTINIYLVDNIDVALPGEVLGYTFGPPATVNSPTKDVIILQKSYLTYANAIPIMHQLGHFFGLRHTYEDMNPSSPATPPPPPGVLTHEFVDRTNCAIHGDGICDTEADPNSVSVVADGKGDFYVPPLDNYMSLYSSSCRFTQQQYNLMADVILTKRMYLH